MNDTLREDVDEALDEAQMVADDGKDQELPEAPASMNIKVWIKGYGVMITARDSHISSLLKKIDTLVAYAESHKWATKWDEPKVYNSPVKDVSATVQPPLCSIHGTPMKYLEGVSKKTGKPYAFWSCPQKLADGSYCNGEAMKV